MLLQDSLSPPICISSRLVCRSLVKVNAVNSVSFLDTKRFEVRQAERSSEASITLLNVLHFQMQAGDEDANGLRTLPVQQLDDLGEKKKKEASIMNVV